MKKNIILSSVAAIAVSGIITFGGCAESSTPNKPVSYSAEKTIDIVLDRGTKSTFSITTEAKGDNMKSKGVKSSSTIKDFKCVDSNKKEAECSTVCTTKNPCKVTIQAACGEEAKLNYSNATDFVGTFAAWHDANGNNADVSEVIDNKNLVAAFSGSANISQTGGIDSCNFDFSSFIVCAITENTKKHAYKSSTNSVDYVMVLIEYSDGTRVWKKVSNTYKSNGVEDGQPFFKLTDLGGKLPVKISVLSILKVGQSATGGTGSSGSIGAAD
jgi:hypothetical protein